MSRTIWPVLTVLLVSTPAGAGETEGFVPRGLAGESFSASATFNRNGTWVAQRDEADLAGFFGSAFRDWGDNRFSIPLSHEQWRMDSQRSLTVNALAIQWEHGLGAGNQLALSARYGDRVASDTESRVLSGTAAVLSWSSLFQNDSRVTGRLFIGDQDARDRSVSYSARRYVGLELEGRYSLWRDHSPFAGFAWQRSDYQTADGNGATWSGALRGESSSRLAAGWAWQVLPNWDIRAEANYRLTDDAYDLLESDRTQLYFSTRFGFR